jgi:hypothetical protein
MDRFIAGSARSNVIKIFDFRFSRPYHYTQAMACGNDEPAPMTVPPFHMAMPHHRATSRCDHILGQLCRWHALSRIDYFRPNALVFIQTGQRAARGNQESVVYSLAKASDVSSSIYAGCTGAILELKLGRDDDSRQSVRDPARQIYRKLSCECRLLETGPGIALDDARKSQRVPGIRGMHQPQLDEYPRSLRDRLRLDDYFQMQKDFTLD